MQSARCVQPYTKHQDSSTKAEAASPPSNSHLIISVQFSLIGLTQFDTVKYQKERLSEDINSDNLSS